MIRNVLTDIDGIGLYGVVSICLFFVVFSGMLAWAFLLKKSTLKTSSRIPFEDGTQLNSAKGNRDHE